MLFAYSIYVENNSINDLHFSFNQIFIVVFFGNISKLLGGLLELIIYFRLKGYQDVSKKNPKSAKEIMIYLIMILMELLTHFLFVFFKQKIRSTRGTPVYVDVSLKGIQIFFACSLTFYFLKYKFENHKKAGLVISGIGLLFSFIVSVCVSKGDVRWIPLTLSIGMNLTAAIHEVLEKYLLHFMYKSPYMILFNQGLFDVVAMFSCYLIVCFCGKVNTNSKDIQWLKNNCPSIIAYGFFCTGYNVFRILINNNSTPTHRIISDSISAMLFFLSTLTKDFSYEDILIGLGYFITFCGSVVYNEVIVFKFWKLNQDTANEINKRIKEEQQHLEKLIETDEELSGQSMVFIK